MIEHFTYRKEGHSTSDDPSAYRPEDEPEVWPFGDPIDRLKKHLIHIGEWDEDRHAAMMDKIKAHVRESYKGAEKLGSLATESSIDPMTMFEQVYEDVPTHLAQQRDIFKSELD